MSFRIAEKEARKSTFKQHRLGAVIVKGGRILSAGYNQRRYSKEIDKDTLHAEEAAIIKLLKNDRAHDLLGSELYVTRFTPTFNIRLARPCDRCMEYIRSVGISRIHYSTNSGTETLKL